MRKFLISLFLAAITYCSWGQKPPEYLTWKGKVITYQGQYTNNKRQLMRLSQRCSCEAAAHRFRLAQKTGRKAAGLTVPATLLGLVVGAGLAAPIYYTTENGGLSALVFMATSVGISTFPIIVLYPRLHQEMKLGVEAFNQCVVDQTQGLDSGLEPLPPP